jgi:hypothetical protein
MSGIETLRYFAQVAEKLEGIAQELSRMKSQNGETAGRLHRLAEAIREDMPTPEDLYELEWRDSSSVTTKPAAISRRGL